MPNFLDYFMNRFKAWQVQLTIALLLSAVFFLMFLSDNHSYILGSSAGYLIALLLISFTYKEVIEE